MVPQAGGISTLVELLETTSEDTRAGRAVSEKVAKTLQAVARHDSRAGDVIRSVGAFPPLLRLLGCGPEDPVTLSSAWALMSLAYNNPANRQAIMEAGGIPPLVSLLSAGGFNPACHCTWPSPPPLAIFPPHIGFPWFLPTLRSPRFPIHQTYGPP